MAATLPSLSRDHTLSMMARWRFAGGESPMTFWTKSKRRGSSRASFWGIWAGGPCSQSRVALEAAAGGVGALVAVVDERTSVQELTPLLLLGGVGNRRVERGPDEVPRCFGAEPRVPCCRSLVPFRLRRVARSRLVCLVARRHGWPRQRWLAAFTFWPAWRGGARGRRRPRPWVPGA